LSRIALLTGASDFFALMMPLPKESSSVEEYVGTGTIGRFFYWNVGIKRFSESRVIRFIVSPLKYQKHLIIWN
jgi:hypothetical protein